MSMVSEPLQQARSKGVAPDSFSLGPTTHITGVFAFSAFLIILAIRSPTAHSSMQTGNRINLPAWARGLWH